MPPPAKVLAEAEVREIVPVPVTVRLVEVAVVHPPEFEIVQVPEPIAIVRMFEFAEEIPPCVDAPDNVTLYPFASRVPAVIVNAGAAPAELIAQASCKTTEPFGEFIVKNCGNVLPALVNVCVALPAKVTKLGLVNDVPVPLIQLPYNTAFELTVSVIVFVVRADMSIVPML